MSVSIIVTCEEQKEQLRKLLPELLSMQYGGDYVDKKHDKDLEEWLEDMEAQYSYLSHTFCPASSRGIDLQKLALTLGAKSANYEWLAILPVGTELPDNWLSRLGACLGEETDVVVGITDRKRRWNWFTSHIFRRRFSLFRTMSSIILCRRSSLLQGQVVKLSKRQIVKL